MSPSPINDEAAKVRRSRAKQACRACNSRRVRCNVLESNPCDNCAAVGATCELVPSRRGRRFRQVPLQKAKNEGRPEHGKSQQTSPLKSPPASGGRPDSVIGGDDLTLNGSEVRSQRVSSTLINDTSPCQATDQVLFFGESNLLTSVATPSSHRSHLCYPISNAINVRASELFVEHSLPTSSSKAHYIAQEGAFTLPDSEDCLAMLQAYFKWFHPCFPVVDRIEVANRYNKGELSLLLLQAMLFIGASYCAEETIHRMGFKNRPEAKSQFYNRAKILYDADWESNEVIVLQSLFLISFWRAGPLNVKNTRYWLAAAISLAQARGYHRSPHLSAKNLTEARLRKRIWWSIYVRDRQSSASLGLPSRIRDEDCDVEMLGYEDFEKEDEGAAIPEFIGSHTHEHEIYAVQMARLAQLLGKVISNEFRPNGGQSDDDERLKLVNELEEWKDDLPMNMRSFEEAKPPENIWVYLLHLAYNYLYILLHRHAYTHLQVDRSAGRPALQAANRVTRIVEDMLSQNLIQFGQMHLITSLFSSLCIHTIEIQRLEGIAKKIAEHRAQVCFLGLKEMQKYWEVNNLVLDLFFQRLDDSTAERLLDGVGEHSSNGDTVKDSSQHAAQTLSVTQPLQTENPPLTPPGGQSVDTYPSLSLTTGTSDFDSFFSDMPRNILNQGGSADDFSLFLDQYLISNKDTGDINDMND